MSKIAIIIPVYNVSRYLHRCLDSIINQTLKDIEIICVNDGSTDNSLNILEEYARNDSRIKIITKENGGLSSARNEGLKYVTSKYVAFVDSDDWIEEKTYQLALDAIEKNDVDLVSWGANIVLDNISEDNPAVISAKNYHDIKIVGYKKLDDRLICNTTVTVWNKLFKVNIIRENNIVFPMGLVYEDNEFFLKYIVHCESAYYIDKYLYNYVQRQGSIISKNVVEKSNKPLDYLEIYKNLYDYYSQLGILQERKILLSGKFNAFLWNTYLNCGNKKLAQKKIQELANLIDNNIIANTNIELAKKNKLYKVVNLNAKKYEIGNYFLGFEEDGERVRFKILNGRVSMKKEKMFSIKNEDNKKIVRILGIKLTFKNNKNATDKKIGDLYYQLNQQKNAVANNNAILYELIKYSLEDKLKNYAKNNKFNGKYPEFDKSIKEEVEKLDKFYFYPNVGNMGDGIIAEAEFQILNNGNYDYKIVDNFTNMPFIPSQEFNLIYGGGGLFVKYWNYQKVLNVFKNPKLKKCIVLPSSFFECDDVLECFDERFTVFCREKFSYDYCISKNNRAKFILLDDMAFSLNLELQEKYDIDRLEKNLEILTGADYSVAINTIYPRIKKLYSNVKNALLEKTVLNSNKVRIGFLMRTDAEKNTADHTSFGIDLSIFANSPCTDSGVVGLISKVFIDTIKSFDVIYTDRLHVGLVSTLLGKEVYLIDNSYKKVSGIYDLSMKKYKNVHLISSINDVGIDEIDTKETNAQLDILEKTLNIEEFLSIYLSKLKYDMSTKDTIWSVK